MALKILTASLEAGDREVRILESLQALPASSSSLSSSEVDGSQHVQRLLDSFHHRGPNGIHTCLVLELLGPSVPALIEARFPKGRLPGYVARRVAQQVVRGVGVLHERGIGHGGMYVFIDLCGDLETVFIRS